MSSSNGDLVERLRKTADGAAVRRTPELVREAADEIERLRARLAEAEQLLRLAYRFVCTAYDGRTVEASIHAFLAGGTEAFYAGTSVAGEKPL